MPLSPRWRSTLKALVTGACALILCVTPIASGGNPSDVLAQHVATMNKDRSVLAFFERNQWLLSDPRFAHEARRQITLHSARLKRAKAKARAARDALHARQAASRVRVERRELLSLRELEPEAAICKVFGRLCGQALRVSRCESGLRIDAQNGQYLGLFQMGSGERRIFGHGATPIEQAQAAHRYFVSSGRDWSPWSCKPW